MQFFHVITVSNFESFTIILINSFESYTFHSGHDGSLGPCLNKNGTSQKKGFEKLDLNGEPTKQKCFLECKGIEEATACEYSDDGTCGFHTYPISGGGGDSSFACLVLNRSMLKPNIIHIKFY